MLTPVTMPLVEPPGTAPGDPAAAVAPGGAAGNVGDGVSARDAGDAGDAGGADGVDVPGTSEPPCQWDAAPGDAARVGGDGSSLGGGWCDTGPPVEDAAEAVKRETCDVGATAAFPGVTVAGGVALVVGASPPPASVTRVAPGALGPPTTCMARGVAGPSGSRAVRREASAMIRAIASSSAVVCRSPVDPTVEREGTDELPLTMAAASEGSSNSPSARRSLITFNGRKCSRC